MKSFSKTSYPLFFFGMFLSPQRKGNSRFIATFNYVSNTTQTRTVSCGINSVAIKPRGTSGCNSSAKEFAAGTYITVTNYNGCSATASAIIIQPNVLSVTAVVTSTVTCNGGSNGSISAVISGGTSVYTNSSIRTTGRSTNTVLSVSIYIVTVNGAYSVYASAKRINCPDNVRPEINWNINHIKL